MSFWSKDREHLVAFHSGPHLDLADVRQIPLQFFQDARAEFAVGHLAPSEPNRRLNLIAFGQPLARVFHAIAVIVIVGAGAKLYFLDGYDDLFLLRLIGLFLGEVLKLAIVDDFANGWLGVRRDLDQIHALFARRANGVTGIHDSELFTVFGNDADLGHANALVDACYRRPAKIGTTAASKTCSYCCTSSVKRPEFRVWSFELVGRPNSKPETRNSKLLIS